MLLFLSSCQFKNSPFFFLITPHGKIKLIEAFGGITNYLALMQGGKKKVDSVERLSIAKFSYHWHAVL